MGDGHCSMRFEETRARGLSTSFFALLDDQIVPASCVVGHRSISFWRKLHLVQSSRREQNQVEARTRRINAVIHLASAFWEKQEH